MKPIATNRYLLLLGMAALCVVAAGVWQGVAAWRSSRQATAVAAPVVEQAAGELVFEGALAHNWGPPITEHCDFRFQLWDAELNGSPSGEAVELDNLPVRLGSFDLALPAAELGEAGLSSWLDVAVRCGGEAEWETLAPRMQHQALAVAAAAKLGIPEAAALVCSVPSAEAASSEHGPLISGVNYRLEGGFRSLAAGGASQP